MGATVDWLESRNAGIEFNGVLKIENDLRNDLKASSLHLCSSLGYSTLPATNKPIKATTKSRHRTFSGNFIFDVLDR
jgi:hypothetical protein